jgi:hypothetical protein
VKLDRRFGRFEYEMRMASLAVSSTAGLSALHQSAPSIDDSECMARMHSRESRRAQQSRISRSAIENLGRVGERGERGESTLLFRLALSYGRRHLRGIAICFTYRMLRWWHLPPRMRRC